MATDNDEMPAWRVRWEAAIRKYETDSGRSLADISESAGRAKSYVSNTLTRGGMPVVDAFLAVCDVIGVSPIGILLDLDLTPDDEELIKLLARVAPEDKEFVREVVLRVLRRGR